MDSQTPPLNLVKLCVGEASPEGLAAWQAMRQAERRARGEPDQPRHITRMWPRRAGEIAGRGSLYWVFRGVIRARQPITHFEPVTGEDGIRRCAIMLDARIVPVMPRPRRAFQGWRYLTAADAPPDLDQQGDPLSGLPEPLRRDLDLIGVI